VVLKVYQELCHWQLLSFVVSLFQRQTSHLKNSSTERATTV